ncbi:hypothetical protein FISHEDRAFT_45603 [Fistulina hepatica ATCC 64428]|uniref:Reverse transcriptase zinc-binding domain-containing protein n=1 Tax=Fistulina hepatica ATCC 64428 TaxID=1128425 RepID=A0A0D7A8J5_9AGAR|nr:hypothetical protein FISHEDRAFT_45603 [Fistulina hepatica ATCC 64428]
MDQHFVIQVLTVDLEKWEDQGWLDVRNGDLFSATAGNMRERRAPTWFQYLNASDIAMIEAHTLAKEGAVKPIADQLIILGTHPFAPPGAKLQQLTLKRVYRELSKKRKVIDRPKTNTHLQLCRDALDRNHGQSPSNEAIWKALSDKDFTNKQSIFLWKSIHDAYKTGNYWDHIPNFEGRGLCPKCSVAEGLEHILLKCEIPGQSLIWSLAKALLELKNIRWPELSLGLIMSIGLVEVRGGLNKAKIGDQRLLKIVIAESLYLIWTIRCERRIEFLDDEAKWKSNNHIRNMWIHAINTCLSIDRMMTNRYKFGKLALKKELVLQTWSGVLLNEDSLPDDWISEPRVLVGRAERRRPRGRNR